MQTIELSGLHALGDPVTWNCEHCGRHSSLSETTALAVCAMAISIGEPFRLPMPCDRCEGGTVVLIDPPRVGQLTIEEVAARGYESPTTLAKLIAEPDRAATVRKRG